MIYLDSASTTPIDPIVLDAMMPYLKEQYGNPGTLYEIGRSAKHAVEKAREQVASFIGAEPQQIIFTSGGTEANNMVFFSLAKHLLTFGKNHIITSAVEHDSVLKAVKEMCIKHGFYNTTLGVDEEGRIIPKDVQSAIDDYRTGIVSVMYVNNETGSENDVEEIAGMCKQKGVLFHTDCVQAASSCKIDVRQIGCDFLSLSSHKLYGPKGCGALFVNHSDERPLKNVLSPFVCGGASQEFGLRGGTENVAAIVGFGKACELMQSQLHDIDVRTSTLKQIFYTELKRMLDAHGLGDILHVNGDFLIKHGKILNIRFDGVDGETLLLMLDGVGVCVSAGSACRSHASEPSHVLTAMGIEPDDARHSIRVSFSKMNTESDVVRAASLVSECVKELHK